MTPAAISLLLAAAAPAGTVSLDCRLVTPGGPVGAAALAPPGENAVLTPATGSVWPLARLVGHGTLSEKKSGLEGTIHFDGSPAGAALKIAGERATLSLTGGARTRLPRAYGFCLPTTPVQSDDKASVTTNAAVGDIRAFHSSSWPTDDSCALITRSGRRGKLVYRLANEGAEAVMSADDGLLPAPKVTMKRGSGTNLPGVRVPYSGGGLSAHDTFLVDPSAAEGVKLLEFDEPGGTAASNEPAAAICGYAMMVRRADTQ
jgi:hypothetical protein